MKNDKINSKVILVGAGPGDKDLLTIKGYNAIKQANIILYDALVNKEILSYANKNVPCIYVGKRNNNHKYSQDDINEMLVTNAINYGTVVRLKGGDPFVFGRGSEEIDYVESRGIETELVPGVSSAISVPASQGIPLTKRGISNSFWVITATVSDGSLPKDFALAAQSSATIVVLMGLRKFSLLINEVQKYRQGYTPFAVIQNGTCVDEKIMTGAINNTANIAKEIDVTVPGIIVFGDVVSESTSFMDEEIQRVLELSL
ncbi:uroporphyrinogen-III C-methyltransferase [Aureibaculum algae]|uniref:uroporphyrinogen-III C-methyltransferase n=1 Tax=Aureibaculum algae TaxID=2584122 RepID=A0A5B7TWG4_9FLAO|nr:uroporphyrinogen-III C-methyltransferase [Aureibaculum algae]QCX40568.1 uroporphyrinogen-III C-methyltransferase [Aureibaculum algae]